ncbi:MAG: OmpA family protein [Pseudohongiellaceae bacterium]
MKIDIDWLVLCAGIFIVLVTPDVLAEENLSVRAYQAPMHEADWSVKNSVFECSLSQDIPQFGEARFYHQAGEQLRFELKPFDRLLTNNDVSLSSVPPPWNFDSPVKEFGLLALAADGQFSIDQDFAKLLMSEMLTGMMPRLSGGSVFTGFEAVEVTLSPLRFRQAYEAYHQCSTDLLPVNFSQINRTTILWPSGSNSLPAEAMKILDSIVLYTQADSSIVGFEVDSFTDTAGERRDNLLLSEERAFLVTNYLIRKGIDPETIATRAHGEREQYLIVNPERTAADRNRNRRVNVVMLRGNSVATSQ